MQSVKQKRMRLLTKKVTEGTYALGAILGIDTYGYPRKLDFIIPSGHTLTIQSKPIAGWQYTGDRVDIDAGSGDSKVYTMDIYYSDESRNNNFWMNDEITIKTTQFIFINAYY